jgi:hypothetical protein
LTEQELQAKLDRIAEQLGKLYRERDPILEQLAELRGAYELPKPRYRTDTQAKVARCPRCSGKLEPSS